MELPVDVFFERIKDATSKLDDSEKIEFYEELLSTGSATVSINKNLEFNFKIEYYDWEVVETEQIDIDDILNLRELQDDIDYIIDQDGNDIIEQEDEYYE